LAIVSAALWLFRVSAARRCIALRQAAEPWADKRNSQSAAEADALQTASSFCPIRKGGAEPKTDAAILTALQSSAVTRGDR
jgi:hypothetical protein